jgi:hypothetical protein
MKPIKAECYEKRLKKLVLGILMVIMFMVTPAFSQSSKKSDSDKIFNDYEKSLYSISTTQIRYPDMTFDYVYDNHGKLQAVTIRGINNQPFLATVLVPSPCSTLRSS